MKAFDVVSEAVLSNHCSYPVPSSALWTIVLDWTLFLSPRTWFGILKFQTDSEFSFFQSSELLRGIFGLLPLVLTTLLLADAENNFQKPFVASFCSPWVLHSIRNVFFQLVYLLKALFGCISSRATVLPSAINVLETRIQQRRAYRQRRFDVFLPLRVPLDSRSTTTTGKAVNVTENTNNKNSKRQIETKAVLIIPGACVPHTAYAEVASRLSDSGLMVVVASMEPLLYAAQHLGADPKPIRRILKKVEQQIIRMGLIEGHNEGTNFEWSLMGHSLGAFSAMRLIQEMQTQNNEKNQIRINKLALWGVAATISKLATDLSKQSHRVLIVQASEDEFVQLTSHNKNKFDRYFPNNTREVTIEGGTHHGFASYKPVLSFQPSNNNKRVISCHEQQSKACDITARFFHEA